MIPRKLLPMIMFWRRNQYGNKPIIDGAARFCKESFTKPSFTDQAFVSEQFCDQSFSTGIFDDQRFVSRVFCDETFTVAEVQNG